MVAVFRGSLIEVMVLNEVGVEVVVEVVGVRGRR